MGTIPPSFIQSVRERTDIIETAQSRIDLKKNGNRYKGLCPFHNEKTPSFTINAEQQFFYCFGCGAKGDVIEFIMQYDHLDFIDALSMLAGQLGLELPRTQDNNNEPQVSKAPYYQLLAQCCQFLQQQLKQSTLAVDYLKQRGLTGQIAKDFALGFAVDQWDALLKHTPKDEHDRLKQCGMLVEKDSGGYYDRFRQRIMFPIRDTRGRIIGFGGRALSKDQQPKYINSPETPVFHKNQALYGLYEALQANRHLDQVVVVEGYMDVIALAQHGISYAVATLGTATNPKHLQLLLRYTQSVIFCFDGDRAGREAAWHALEVHLPMIRDGVSCRFVLMPEGEDPDSLVRQHGAEHLKRLFNEGAEAADFLFEHLDQSYPRENLADIARYAKVAQKLIHTLPSGLYRNLLDKRLARHLDIETDELSAVEHSIPKKPIQQTPSEASTVPMDPEHLTQDMPTVRMAIALLLQQPALASKAPDSLQQLDNDHSEYRLFKHLLKRLNDQPKPSVHTIIEECDNPKLAQYLAILIAWEPSFPKDGFEAEFHDIITKLLILDCQARANQLIDTAKQRPLSQEEKQQLQALIKQAAQYKQPTT